jgi:uncharacterized short protein YbdD (DUF466 family)
MAQRPRELTPQEVAEGVRNIHDRVLSATQIQALVRNMDSSKKKWSRLKSSNHVEYMKKLKDENEELYFNFPPIFDKHAKDELDSTFFEMLTLKRKMEKGELTADQASAIVGQKMFNRYVPHVISNTAPPPNPMSYEDFYRQHENNN